MERRRLGTSARRMRTGEMSTTEVGGIRLIRFWARMHPSGRNARAYSPSDGKASSFRSNVPPLIHLRRNAPSLLTEKPRRGRQWAASPHPISAMPMKCCGTRRSPNTNEPSRMADTGIRNVTSRRFVAPAVARMRKYST